MAYCGPRGIAWDEFLAWSKTSRDAAIVWQLRHQQACGSCGTHPDAWDPARGGHDHAYVAEVRSCRGCETVASAQKQIPKELVEIGAHIALVHNPEAT